ncbi:MAG TPA: DUF2304 family protein [Thermoanaerobaculia bacterium]
MAALTNFQIAALTLAACVLVAIAFQRARGRVSTRIAFAWGALWVAAAVAVANPELTRIVANFLGIARGADLVFYLAILGMFLGFFAVHLRLRRFESELTKIVRELALRAPKEPGSGD